MPVNPIRCVAFFMSIWFAGVGIGVAPASILAHEVGPEMAQAAQLLLASLTPEQQQQIQFPFDDPLRQDWQFVPMDRRGLALKEMQPQQRGLAMALVQTALSHRGFSKSMQIMALEQVLHEMENGNATRDPAKYNIFLFGKPTATGNWGWRMEGHHLSLTVTVVDGKSVVVAPGFFGANPAEVRTGPMTGLRVLGQIEDQARRFARELDADQQQLAILDDAAPKDVINGPGRKAEILQPSGIPATSLSPDQQRSLLEIVDRYLENFRPELVQTTRQSLNQEGVKSLQFVWIGKTEIGNPHYFRIQGPAFVMEYDNTQNQANHVHLVWRDLKNDFGQDELQRHYQLSHPQPEPIR